MRSLPSRQRQRGVALMAMLAVLILGATWWTVTALSNVTNRTAEQRAQNAQVLQQAKSALMGWVAQQAAMAAEANPGRLPCPEPAANIGTANQGLTANTCALPAVGRLPWRTLGLDQLRDAAGEPLWYVVSPNWTLDGVVANTLINSNSTGQLALDAAAPDDVVALIIAPGAPISVVASANCLARNQVRPSIDPRDYVECQNAVAGATAFVSGGPAGSFNDQVLAITGAELLPAIEAAVIDRFQRAIAPLIRSAYSNNDAANPNPSWPAEPLLPFAAPFANPDPSVPLPPPSDYKGTLNTTQGLLPLTYSTNPADGTPCTTIVPADIRCDPNFISWRIPPANTPTVTGATVVAGSVNCGANATLVTCTFRASYPVFAPNITVTISHRANNIGMALRQFDTTVAIGGMNAVGRSATGAMQSDGSADLAVTGTLPAPAGGNILGDLLCNIVGLLAQILNNCANYTVTLPIGLMVDHPVVQDNVATNPQHWFLRNRWHHVSFYAVAPPISPQGAAPRACAGANCLTLNFARTVVQVPAPPVVVIGASNPRGVLVIAGRALPLIPQIRPSIALNTWLEDTNSDGDTVFAVRETPPLVMNRTFNDRVAVIDP